MKRMTAIRWFKTMPEPYRSLATHNFKKYYSDRYEPMALKKALTSKFKSLVQSIDYFTWSETPEGYDFWHSVYARLDSAKGDTSKINWPALPK